MNAQWSKGRRFRAVQVLAALVAVVALVGAVNVGTSLAGTDPEPRVITDVQWDFAPGPGWPEGWTPPAAPTSIPQDVVDVWEWEKSSNPAGTAQRLEMRVLPFLPDWTTAFPYVYQFRMFRCGQTEYVYFYPTPDRELLYDVYGDGYQVIQGAVGGEACVFTPVTVIKPTRMTPEEQRQFELRQRLVDDFAYARLGHEWQGGLNACSIFTEGSLDSIYVCFNEGDASQRFDLPAYLDLEAKRVRVPVRFVSELMGATVDWDENTQTVSISFTSRSREIAKPIPIAPNTVADWVIPEVTGFDGSKYRLEPHTITQPARTITLQVGNTTALVDGEEVTIDAPPVLLPPGRVMVPVRFVSEALGAKVYWVGMEPIWTDYDKTRKGRYQVHIYTPFFPFFEYPSWFLETRGQRT